MRNLFVLPLSILYAAGAGAAATAQEAAASNAQIFAIPGSDAITRLQMQDGEWVAGVSRDGGASWRTLPQPKFTISTQLADFDPAIGDPPVPGLLAAMRSNELHLVQFHTPPVQEFRDAMSTAGAEILVPMANQAYLVRMSGSAEAAIAGFDFVRAVSAYHPAYRLEPAIIASLTADADLPATRYNIIAANYRTDMDALERAVERVGGTVEMVDGSLLSATLTGGQLLQVASENTVMWIDRWTAPEYDMNNALAQAGVAPLHGLATPIDGKGIRTHVNEGIQQSHPEFAARAPYRTAPISVTRNGSSTHGTNTAGEVFAQGLRALFKGSAPFAQGYYSASVGSYNTLAQTLTQTHQVLSSTQSWGGGRTTSYTSTSVQADLSVFNWDIWKTQSQSNAGARPSRPEAWAKNINSVGGFNHFNNSSPADDCWCRTGSIGPASDGRIGVTFTGYYDSINTTSTNSGYTNNFGGTSGATPMVNGFGLLAMTMFSDGLFGYPGGTWQERWNLRAHASTVKALMMATTRPLPTNRATRVQQGWGFPNIGDMYAERDNLLVIDEENATLTGPSRDVLSQGQSRTYFVYVAPATNAFRAALTYTEPPGNPANQSRHRLNDLDVEAFAPDGTRYAGNLGLGNSNVSPAAPTGKNSLDTEEMIMLNSPQSGVWTVKVTADEILADSHIETAATDADYALVVRGVSGGRDLSGMVMDVISNQPGDLRVSLTGVPASGWSTGFTLMSVDTSRHAAMGNVLGLEADALTASIVGFAPSAGNVFAFTNAGPSVYPYTTFTFPAAIAQIASGLVIDATAVLIDNQNNVVEVSNVDRQQVQ